MPRSTSVFAVILVSIASASPCLAQSQGQMNEDAQHSLGSADKKLNSVYKAVIAKNAKNPLMVAKLKHAQKTWIAYRDAMLDLQYPVPEHGTPGIIFGSVYPMCNSMTAESLTKKQTDLLAQWLKNHDGEGDVCLGSQDSSYDETDL